MHLPLPNMSKAILLAVFFRIGLIDYGGALVCVLHFVIELVLVSETLRLRCRLSVLFVASLKFVVCDFTIGECRRYSSLELLD